jgi:hypothetical protein
MSSPGPERSFWDDSRGISALIGVMFLFAFAVILISMNQAYIVPQENSEIEFNHFQDSRSDLVDVRSSISTAGQADVSQYPTVRLGTNYPARIFAVNPPPPSGTLQTTQAYDIRIENQSGSDPETVSTRFLEYRNGYNELEVGSVWYEHSVLYLDERNDGGGIVIYEDQNIIAGNETARVTALQNDFSVSSTGRVTLNLYPTETARINSSNLAGDVTIKIPSRLDGSTYWDEAIDTTESDNLSYEGTESYPGESDIYWVVLTVEAEALNFNTVGIETAPESQTSAKQGVGAGNGDEESESLPVCESGNRNVNGNVNGDIAVTGNVNVNSGRRVMGNVTAGGDVIVNSGGRIDGNIQAEGSVIINSGAFVGGDISAGGDVTERGGSYVGGSTTENIDDYSPCNG